jgi:integrase
MHQFAISIGSCKILVVPRTVKRGTMPSFHGFRHTAASEAIAAGDSAEEASWQLGHKNSVVTRSIYVQEIKSTERTARRRARM